MCEQVTFKSWQKKAAIVNIKWYTPSSDEESYNTEQEMNEGQDCFLAKNKLSS